MPQATTSLEPTPAEPLPPAMRDVQPGGGAIHSLELAWGRIRRGYLTRFRPGYVRRMAALRQGSDAGAPHPLLDPRDLKFCRPGCQCHWAEADDPFAWRGRLPFARWGLAELVCLSLMGLLLVAVGLALWPPAAIVPAAVVALVIYFFRDPRRPVPGEPGALVSPADGRVVEIAELEHDEFVGGPAVRIGIFLSVFNVHINRVPERARVIRLRYEPGKFLNALLPRSARENECVFIGLETLDRLRRRIGVRQIAGAIARRIVCDLRPGETVARGHKFGMIKLGSRTELLIPNEPGLEIRTRVGQNVRGGCDVLARFPSTPGEE